MAIQADLRTISQTVRSFLATELQYCGLNSGGTRQAMSFLLFQRVKES